MRVFGKTDIGAHRETNQDAFRSGVFENGDCWAVVCDGMGGVSGGQVASAICVEKVSDAINRGHRDNMTVKTAQNLLNSAICAANASIFDEAQKDKALSGMGTTVVAVMVIRGIAVVAHVGDSRAYLFGDDIKPITKDHSLVQFLVDSGKITEEEAKIHPDRNIITGAVGILSVVDVDFDIVDVNENDNILICTDGLNGAVEDIKILEVINEYGENSPEKLVEAAISAGGRDNITAVVLYNQGA